MMLSLTMPDTTNYFNLFQLYLSTENKNITCNYVIFINMNFNEKNKVGPTLIVGLQVLQLLSCHS